MLIPCPYCGTRDAHEFTVIGDAALTERPDPDAPDAAARFHAYAFLRANPAGPHRELWYHASGCRRLLVVHRDTRTHAILDVAFAAPVPSREVTR